jgi:hypothetical protein
MAENILAFGVLCLGDRYPVISCDLQLPCILSFLSKPKLTSSSLFISPIQNAVLRLIHFVHLAGIQSVGHTTCLRLTYLSFHPLQSEKQNILLGVILVPNLL